MNRTAILLLLVPLTVGLSAQDLPWTPDTLSADFVVGTPVAPTPGSSAWIGGRAEWDFLPGPWGVELGYAYRSKEYFSFDHSSNRWSGPWSWDKTDAGGVSQDEWPFYQTRHVLSPGLVFRGKESWVLPHVSVGLLVQFYVSSDASEYYPDFQDSFARYLTGVQALFGNYLKLGLDLRPWPLVTFGADFVYEVPQWGLFFSQLQSDPVAYARDHAHFEFRAGVRL